MTGSSMIPVLVTGGAGYIGSHVCKALAQSGYCPVTFDNLSRGHRQAVKWGPFEQGDLRDLTRLRQVIRTHQPVAVMHFAAFTDVGESTQNPLLYYKNNVGGSITLIEAMVESRILHMVFSSSCTVYGKPTVIPLTEAHPIAPISPYGKSKAIIEDILSACDQAHSMRSISLRYFNAAGADPDGDIGENHQPETHLIPNVLKAALGIGDPLRVLGNDYDTPDGTCIRDYIHVTDLAAAHVLALKYLLAGGSSQRLNLSNNQGFSVMEVIEVAQQVTKQSIPFTIGSRRMGDAPCLIGDSSLARQVLGWDPVYADLATIVEHAWRWIQSSP